MCHLKCGNLKPSAHRLHRVHTSCFSNVTSPVRPHEAEEQPVSVFDGLLWRRRASAASGTPEIPALVKTLPLSERAEFVFNSFCRRDQT